MNTFRAMELMEVERACMERNYFHLCDRDCADCDLVQEDEELLDAYDQVIEVLKGALLGNEASCYDSDD